MSKYLIVGLGNPGREYAQTRHNAGFWVIDELQKRFNLPQYTTERKALTTNGMIAGRSIILAKPQTYMNLSGESVRALVDYYKVDTNHILVIYDDMDLDVGILRLRATGGHGGQNGMRNIIKHLGTKDFARARFGIGRPPGRMQGKDYVLSKFTGDEAILGQQVVETAADAIELWLKEGIQLAMSRYNGDVDDSGGADDKPAAKERLEVVQRAHELNPSDPKPLQEMARLYKQMRQLDDAADTHLKLADIYAEQENTKSMLYEMQQAVSVRPMRVDIREDIAHIYEAEENTKRAVQTWVSLAQYHMQQDEHDGAMRAIEHALRLNPQHPKALALQDELHKRLTM